MRISVLFLTMFITMAYMSCQYKNEDVPKAVKASFEAKYPNEKEPDWGKDKNENFEAKFKKDGKDLRADFTPQGKWVETENSIDEDDLPEVIKEILETEFDDHKVIEVEEVEHNSKGFYYDVEISKEKKKKDIMFTKDGTILN